MKTSLLAAGLAFGIGSLHAAPYPTKPLRLIVPFPAGGSTDTIGRLVGEHLGDRLGQRVVIDNRPGASGNLGSEIAARSAPDGHTLVMGTVATVTINQSLYGKLNYDPAKDLVPLTTVASAFQVLLAHPSGNVDSVPALIRAAKAKPGVLIAASASNGTTGHLSLELLKILTGIDIAHVPYKGASPARTAVLSGEVHLLFDSITTAVPHVVAGKVRALGVTSAKRSVVLPHVPAIDEFVPGFETTGWFALLVPAGTPSNIQDTLVRTAVTVLREKETASRISALGAETLIVTGLELDRFIAKERQKWARVIKSAKVRMD